MIIFLPIVVVTATPASTPDVIYFSWTKKNFIMYMYKNKVQVGDQFFSSRP